MCRACAGGTAAPVAARIDLRRPHVLLARGLIRLYRYTLSAFVGRTCRYLPTCSEYTEDAISRHGLWAGGWMGLMRIGSCHPWGGSGYDPVQATLPADVPWWTPWRYRVPPEP